MKPQTIKKIDKYIKKASKYKQQKNKLRDFAIEWQRNLTDDNYSMAYFAYWGSYFYRLGKRYGLLKEFKENAIL